MEKNTYPVEEWKVTEEKFVKEWNYRNETTFALSNGYIGTRGTFDEGYPFSVDEGLEGNFINGFYESEHIMYGEWNFGFPEKSQSLLNLPNLKKTTIEINGEILPEHECFDTPEEVLSAIQNYDNHIKWWQETVSIRNLK